MCHMGIDQVASRQCSTGAQFTRQHSRSHDPGQLSRIRPWIGEVGASDPQQVEHGRLGFEDGPAADCADLY